MQWQAFATVAPPMAEFGLQRLKGQVAYLATSRPDGSPRVHPVTPFLGLGHLFVFIHRKSPKGYDLRRDGRYALHSSVGDTSGARDEFLVSGRATLIEDPGLRRQAVMIVGHPVPDEQLLFELLVEQVLATEYVTEAGSRRPVRQHWSQPDP